jgi:hypothetical membrane protein
VDRGASAGRLGLVAIAGIAVYVAIDIALVFLRPQFSVLHNAESDYGSRGPYGWLMDANFLLRCALTLAVIWALARVLPGRLRSALALLAVWAVASGLLALFPDDPVGTPTHGLARVHLALAAIAFFAVVLGTRLGSRGLRHEPSWQPVTRALALISWAALVPILLLGRAKLRPHSLGGLWEKTFLGVELLWLAVVALWIVFGAAE